MAEQTNSYTPIGDLKDIHNGLIKTFKSGITRPLAYRRRQLLQLARMMQDNIVPLEDAALADLGKQRQECNVCEISPIITACLYAANKLEEWTNPEKPTVEPFRASWDATVYPIPKGVALLISPWNFPIILTFQPLVGAIAAGCPAVLKPSESTPTCSALIAALLPKYLDPAAYAVVLGAVPETTALLQYRWDHIFFTGGGKVGRIIAAKAGEMLTPVTLELGGKSPVLIDTDCNFDLAAKRILWGKVQNSGQLCVSPDYIIVPKAAAEPFKEALKKAYAERFPNGALHPDTNWSRIVNKLHWNRLKDLMARTQGKILAGGEDDGNLRISPTIYTDVKLDDALMEDEIFGPLIPVIEVEDVDAAIETVANRPTPLVIYVFTNRDAELRPELLSRTNSGMLTLNDTFLQMSAYELPFGGLGDSGYGACHGKYSFDTFTKLRAFAHIPLAAEPFFTHRYLPYTAEGYQVMTAPSRVKIPDE